MSIDSLVTGDRMKRLSSIIFLTLVGAGMNGCDVKNEVSWKEALNARLPVYGHRNWIVVVDAAYPLQSRQGIETIATHEDQLSVVGEVLKDMGGSKHVKATVYLDKELKYVTEKDAPGIEVYRNRLTEMLGERNIITPLHEDLIAKLDEAGKTFNVLILKSTLTLPYTSVFFELGCGYWDDGAEQRLRDELKGK